MLTLLLALSLPAEACESQRHALGGFVAFDASGGWWGWDGRTHTDALVVGDALSPGNRVLLVYYDEDGVPVEVRAVPRDLLAAAYRAQPVVETLVLGGAEHPVREAMSEAALAGVIPEVLGDRQLIGAVATDAPGAELHLPPLERTCHLRQLVLRTPDGERQAVHVVEGHEASPLDQVDGARGHGELLSGPAEVRMHPDGSHAVVEMMWGARGAAHAVSRTAHVVLPLSGACQGADCREPLVTQRGCSAETVESRDGGEAGWLRVVHVRDDDVLYVRDRATPDGQVLGELQPDQRCIWGHLPIPEAEQWAWLPGQGWAHAYYLAADAGECTARGE